MRDAEDTWQRILFRNLCNTSSGARGDWEQSIKMLIWKSKRGGVEAYVVGQSDQEITYVTLDLSKRDEVTAGFGSDVQVKRAALHLMQQRRQSQGSNAKHEATSQSKRKLINNLRCSLLKGCEIQVV